MSSDVFSKDEKHRILIFTELEPIEVVGGNGARIKNIQPNNSIGGRARW